MSFHARADDGDLGDVCINYKVLLGEVGEGLENGFLGKLIVAARNGESDIFRAVTADRLKDDVDIYFSVSEL